MALLKINGKQFEYNQSDMPATMADLLDKMNIDSSTVVAEVNGDIVRRENFEGFTLIDGQSIELIRFVGGG